jgi:hypothetical protein
VRPKQKPLIVLMVKRVVFFLAIVCSLTAFLYGIGNAQDFLDSTQLVLLRLSATLGILLTVSAVFGMGIDIYFCIRGRSLRFLWGAFAYCLIVGFGVFSAVFFNGVLVLVAGNTP